MRPRHIFAASAACLTSLLVPLSAAYSTPKASIAAQVTIVDSTPFVDAEGTLVLHVSVTNAPTDATLSLFIGKRIRSTAELSGPVGAQFSGGHIYDAPNIATSQKNGAGQIELAVKLSTIKLAGVDDTNVRLRHPGVYPIGLEVVSADEQVIASTSAYFVRTINPDEPRHVTVAFVASLHAQPTVDSLGVPSIDEIDVQTWRRTFEFLDAHPDLPATLALPSEFVAALNDATQPHLSLLEIIRRVVRRPTISMVASPAVSLPIAELVRFGSTSLLKSQIAAGVQQLTSVLSKAPDSSTVFVDDKVSSVVVGALNEVGVTTVVDLLGTAPPVSRLAQPAVNVITPDAEVVTLLKSGNFATDLRTAMLKWTIATLPDLDQPANESIRRVVAIDNQFLDNAKNFDQFASMVTASPIARLGTVTDVFDLSAPLFSDPTNLPTRQLGNVAALQTQADNALEDLMSLSQSPTTVESANAFRSRLRYLFSSDITNARRSSYSSAIVDAVNRSSHGVGALSDETFTLTSHQGDIPISVVYAGETPINATLHLESSDRLSYPHGDTVGLKLMPGKNQIAFVVRAKTSGVQTILVRITTPNGRIELTSARVTIRSTVVSGVGVVLSVASLTVLFIWWARNWRRTRQRSAQSK